MKKKYFLLLGIITLITISNSFAQQDSTHFVTTWKTDNQGFSNDSAIVIGTNSVFNYNYDVDWNNDGIFDTLGVTSDLTIQYSSPGTYTVRIRGVFPAIDFVGAAVGVRDQQKIVSIDQWGTLNWETMYWAFKGCSNLVCSATDAPNLSGVTDISGMFSQATNFTGDLSSWDVSNIVYMTEVFDEATQFNSDISNWDVSNVISMFFMFSRSSSFNQDISGWDVSKVKNMEGLFADATSFNQDISSWSVDSVTSMDMMFSGATAFNKDISNWDIQSVNSMVRLFGYSGLSRTNYDLILTSWQSKPHQMNVSVGAENLKYCLGDSARALLIADGWTFNGDTLDCQLVGIKENRTSPTFKVYPNPAFEQFTIETDQNFDVIHIYNSFGQKVLESNSKTTNIEALDSGVYFIQILNGNATRSSTFIKK